MIEALGPSAGSGAGRLFCFGLGYSALAFARRLRARGWSVAGTTRTQDKADRLAAPGFDRDALLAGMSLDPSRPTILFAPTGGKNNALAYPGPSRATRHAVCTNAERFSSSSSSGVRS